MKISQRKDIQGNLIEKGKKQNYHISFSDNLEDVYYVDCWKKVNKKLNTKPGCSVTRTCLMF